MHALLHNYVSCPRVCKLLNAYSQTCIVLYVSRTLCDTYFSNTRDLCERKTTFSIVCYKTIFTYMYRTYGNVRYMFA